MPTKVHLVKAMVFPAVMYGCESWTIKKAEHRRIDAFELCYWRGTLESLLDCNKIQPVNPKEYWSGLPFPSPGDLPYPGIKSGSPALQADSLPSEHTLGAFCSVALVSLSVYKPVSYYLNYCSFIIALAVLSKSLHLVTLQECLGFFFFFCLGNFLTFANCVKILVSLLCSTKNSFVIVFLLELY